MKVHLRVSALQAISEIKRPIAANECLVRSPELDKKYIIFFPILHPIHPVPLSNTLRIDPRPSGGFSFCIRVLGIVVGALCDWRPIEMIENLDAHSFFNPCGIGAG